MGGAVSLVVLVAGMILIWGAGPQVAGVDSMLAGLVLVIVGATGVLLAFLLWSTGPRPASRQGAPADRLRKR